MRSLFISPKGNVMKRKLLVLAFCSLAVSSVAFSATITSNAITVKATIVPACVFMLPDNMDTGIEGSTVFTTAIDFGTLTPDPGAVTVPSPYIPGAEALATAAANVRCTVGTGFSAETSSTAATPFTMTGPGSAAIPYTTMISVNNGPFSAGPVSGVGVGMGVLGSATGNIPVQVRGVVTSTAYDVAPGSYADTTLRLLITY